MKVEGSHYYRDETDMSNENCIGAITTKVRVLALELVKYH